MLAINSSEKGTESMENELFMTAQIHYLILREAKAIDEVDANPVTNEKLTNRLTKNLQVWKTLKDRQTNDTRALIDGSLSKLAMDHLLKRLAEGEYVITEAGKERLDFLIEEIISEAGFEFPNISEGLSDVQLHEVIYNQHQYEYDLPKNNFLTSADIAPLAERHYRSQVTSL